METLETFQKRVEEFDNKLKDYYFGVRDIDEGGKNPILDGIVNFTEYFNSPLRILWILKEPYDKENNGGSFWELNKLLNNEKALETLGGFKSTWYPIIYTTYAILNNFQKYDDLSFIKDDPLMLNILKKMAIMNVQKFPAETTTNNNDISNAYIKHSSILLKQIETYNPDIVIGGNTLHNFIQDLGLGDIYKTYDEYDYWIKDNRLYIEVEHPAFRGNEEAKEEYVDDIVRISKNFYDNTFIKRK